MDFPDNWIAPINISSFSRYCGEPGAYISGLSTGTNNVSLGTSGETVYIPLNLPGPFLIRSFFWVNGTGSTSSNITMGIRTTPGSTGSSSTLLVQSAATAQGSNATTQVVTPTGGPYLLAAGLYLLGFTAASTGSTFQGRSVATQIFARHGYLGASTALAVPDATQISMVPMCGISRWDSTSSKQIW